ncbi:polysaccharide deacetylase WbmS family protein [Novosphingobium beihaiensis]|uniref:Uncharacterized protein n=1 Tax=Novosphingobium beihaiensis TaxID=2930389 RepID=A0ABT0BTU5_9SPHN|nr:hypothetical protein [Novosphingobium beihaiensis]MCJ2188099.1 hypothetical protein [Novosphingobium beihaiensis]
MATGQFVLTGDVDWASEHCLRSYIEHAASHGIVPTLFVTHPSAVIEEAAAAGKVHLGIHPNFMPGSTHGASPEQILDYVFDLVPQPVAARSHCFFDNSHVAAALARRGITVDSNICCHMQPELPVLQHWNGIKRLPVFFEDDVHWERGGEWTFARYQAAFATPGLKILNFHPFMWALNVPDAEFYTAHRAHIPALTGDQAQAMRFRGPGSATFLDDIIRWVRQTGGEFISLPQLCETLQR